MAYVISTSDLEGIPVFLGEVEWQRHILKRHPEVADFLNDIEGIIRSPDIRHRDSENERINLYHRRVAESRRLHPNLS